MREEREIFFFEKHWIRGVPAAGPPAALLLTSQPLCRALCYIYIYIVCVCVSLSLFTSMVPVITSKPPRLNLRHRPSTVTTLKLPFGHHVKIHKITPSETNT